jgi:hypothetical protein
MRSLQDGQMPHSFYADQISNNFFVAEARAGTAVAPLPGGETSAFCVHHLFAKGKTFERDRLLFIVGRSAAIR